MAKESKILVIDDDTTNLSYLTEVLEGTYDLLTASTGEEGLKAASTFKPNIILLDIMMPGIDGYEVCEQLRSDKNLAETKILFLSAKWQVAEKLRGYHVGGDDFITKPFDAAEIIAKIKVFERLNYLPEAPAAKEILPKEKNLEIFYHIKRDLANIIYIKSEAPYCRVFSCSLRDSPDKHRITIHALEAFFNQKNLLRIHRSYLVNPQKILSVNRQKNNEYKLLVKDNNDDIAMVPVGRSYHDKLKAAIPNLFPL